MISLIVYFVGTVHNDDLVDFSSKHHYTVILLKVLKFSFADDILFKKKCMSETTLETAVSQMVVVIVVVAKVIVLVMTRLGKNGKVAGRSYLTCNGNNFPFPFIFFICTTNDISEHLNVTLNVIHNFNMVQCPPLPLTI